MFTNCTECYMISFFSQQNFNKLNYGNVLNRKELKVCKCDRNSTECTLN